MKTADSTHICPFTCILEGDAQETIAEENACRGFYTAIRIDPEGEHTRNTYPYMEGIMTDTAMLASEN